MAEMNIIAQGGNKTIAALSGRLDTEGVERLEETFTAAIVPLGKATVLDFSGVTFMSSMGIRMLVSAAKSLSRRAAKMVILSPQPLVRESIESAALDQLIPVADTMEDADLLLGVTG